MEFNISKEWCKKMAELEEDCDDFSCGDPSTAMDLNATADKLAHAPSVADGEVAEALRYISLFCGVHVKNDTDKEALTKRLTTLKQEASTAQERVAELEETVRVLQNNIILRDAALSNKRMEITTLKQKLSTAEEIAQVTLEANTKLIKQVQAAENLFPKIATASAKDFQEGNLSGKRYQELITNYRAAKGDKNV